jgi:hypothetical protein
MKPKRLCRCACCEQLFFPDPRSRHRQKFCPEPACRKASKAASQRRWRSKPENQDYWRGAEQVERVQLWRKANPHRRKRVLQEDCPRDAVVKIVKSDTEAAPLQDDCLPSNPLLVGLIAALAGSALQEDIAAACRQLIAKGREILRRQSRADT